MIARPRASGSHHARFDGRAGSDEDAQQSTVRLEDPDPQRDGHVDPPVRVHLHPVGTAGLSGIEPGEDAARADAQRPVVSTSKART